MRGNMARTGGFGAGIAVTVALLAVAGVAPADQPAAAAKADASTAPPPSAAAAPAAASAPQRTILARSDVPGSNLEVVYALIDVPAHVEVARHTHPGGVFGYLLEGEYTMMIDGEPPRVLRPGEWLQVPPGVPHAERSGERAARLLAVFTVEKGRPLTTPAP